MDEMLPNNNGTPMEAKPESPNFRLRFFWLVAAQVVIGVLAGLVTHLDYRSEWLSELPGCIMVSQISLLGVWGGQGGTALWKRLIGVLLGISYLMILVKFGIGVAHIDALIFIFCLTASTVFMTLSVRFITGAIYHESSSAGESCRRQFSVRRLFGLTTVVAFLAAALKLVHSLIDDLLRQMLFGIFVYSLAYAVIAIVPMWCVLAMKRPVLLGILVVAVAACVGDVFGHLSQPKADIVGMFFMATQATYVVITLLIVRSWGYRLLPIRSRRRVVEPSSK